MLEQLGTASVAIWNELLGIIGFFGAMVVALFNHCLLYTSRCV